MITFSHVEPDALTARGAIKEAARVAEWLLQFGDSVDAKSELRARRRLGRLLHRAYAHRRSPSCVATQWTEPERLRMPDVGKRRVRAYRKSTPTRLPVSRLGKLADTLPNTQPRL